MTPDEWYEKGWEAGVETCALEVERRLGLANLAEHLRKVCLPTNPPRAKTLGPKVEP